MGVHEVTPVLNEYYLETLDNMEFKTLLDEELNKALRF